MNLSWITKNNSCQNHITIGQFYKGESRICFKYSLTLLSEKEIVKWEIEVVKSSHY